MIPLPERLRAPSLSRHLARRLAPAALAALFAVAAGPVGAERADRDKPLNFAADALRYDDARQTNVLTGNVVITKGTMSMRAARVEVRQTADGHQAAVAIGAAGKPALYRQKRDRVDEYVEGEAERIEYDGRADTLKLVGNAVIRRYRGETLADEIKGQTITYDNVAEVFTVDGGASGSSASPDGSGGRVRGTLSPRSTPAAPAPPASAPQETP